MVIGYGMIGKNVAKELAKAEVKVMVYDKDDVKNLEAFADGFQVNQKRVLIPEADIIFCATGDPNGALSYDEIFDHCANDVILASVGSRDTEFDLAELKIHKTGAKSLGEHLVRYEQARKSWIVMKDGTAVNFILRSIPEEILDLVFSEILSGILALFANPERFPAKQQLYETERNILGGIGKDWLRFLAR